MSAINTNNPQQQPAGSCRQDNPQPNAMPAETFVKNLCIVICDSQDVAKLQSLVDSIEFLSARIIISPRLSDSQAFGMRPFLQHIVCTTEATLRQCQPPKHPVSVVNNFDNSTYVENMGDQTVNNMVTSGGGTSRMIRPDAPTGHRPETEHEPAESH